MAHLDRLRSLLEPLFAELNEDTVAALRDYVHKERPPFAEVMEAMQQWIVSANAAVRASCFDVLRELIADVPIGYLQPDEVNHVTAFICGRLGQEPDACQKILRCIIAMTRQFVTIDEFCVKVFDALSKNIIVQQLSVAERYSVYQSIGVMLERNFEALERLGSTLVLQMIQIIEGERDPRCLLLTFKLFRSVFGRISAGAYDEDAFDVVSCYFPITYTQPRSDPYNISRSDLADLLAQCLSIQTSFAQYGLPLFMEKISSDLDQSKQDGYSALACSASTYGLESLEPFLETIRTTIRIDVLTTNSELNSELVKSALSALSALVRLLDSDPFKSGNFLTELCRELEPALIKGELGLRSAATRLITAMSVTPRSFEFVAQKLLPFVLERLSSVNEDRAELLECLHGLLESRTQLITSESPMAIPLPSRDAVIHTIILNLSRSHAPELLRSAFSCCQSLLRAGDLVGPDELVQIRSALSDTLRTLPLPEPNINDSQNDSPKSESSNSVAEDELFQAISHCYRQIQSSPNVSAVIDELIAVLQQQQADQSDLSQHNAIRMLATLQLSQSEQRTLIQILLRTIHTKPDPLIPDRSAIELLTRLIEEQSSDSDYLYRNVLWPLLTEHLHARICEAADFQRRLESSDPIVFEAVAALSAVMSAEHSRELTQLLSESYVLNKIGVLLEPNKCSANCATSIKIVNRKVVELLVVAAESIFSNVVPRAIADDCVVLLERMLDVPDLGAHYHNLLGRTICAVANKSDEEAVGNLMHLVQGRFSARRTEQNLQLLAWLAKGLAMRNHSHAQTVVEWVMTVLEDTGPLARAAASCFGLLHGPVRIRNGNESPFYHQKLFQITSAVLNRVATDQNRPNEVRTMYRMALLVQLQHLPRAFLLAEARRFQNLILAALTDSDPHAQTIAVQCLSMLLDDLAEDSVISLPAYALVSNLLSVLEPEKTSGDDIAAASADHQPLNLRREALGLLGQVPGKFRDSELLPVREQVLKALKPFLDDRKRLVRTSASEARMKWFLLGQADN